MRLFITKNNIFRSKIQAVRDQLKPIFTIGAAAGFANIFMIIYSFLLARWLGPDLYGVMSANYSLATLSVFVVNWGLDTWLLRQAPINENPSKLAGHVILIKLSLGAIWAITIFGIAPVLSPDIYIRPILGLVIFNTILDSIINVLYVYLVATSQATKSSLIFIIDRLLRLVITIIMINLGRKSISEYVGVRIVIDFIFVGLAWDNVKPVLSLNQHLLKINIFRQALPYGYSEALNIIYYQADINLLTMLSGEGKLIGYYSVIIGLTNALSGAIQSALNPIIPVLTRLFLQKKQKLLRATIFTMAGFTLVGSFLWFGVTIWGKELVRLTLGERYYISGIFWLALSPIFPLKSLSLSATAFLISVDQQNRRLIPQIIAVAFKIIMTVIVFPVSQVIGIIQVYILSEFILLIGYAWLMLWWYRSVWIKRDE